MIMAILFQLRLEKILMEKQSAKKVQEMNDAVKMTDRLVKLRTYKSLMTGMIVELKKFLNFNYCAVLFYD